MVRQTMNLYPLNLFRHRRIPFCSIRRIKAGILVQLLYFHRAVDLVARFVIQLGTFFITLDSLMTIHTHVHRWNGSVPALPGVPMTVQTTDLVDTRVYAVRIIDGLPGFVRFLTTQADGSSCNIKTDQDKYYNSHKRDVDLILIKRNGVGTKNSFFVVGKFLQVAINLH